MKCNGNWQQRHSLLPREFAENPSHHRHRIPAHRRIGSDAQIDANLRARRARRGISQFGGLIAGCQHLRWRDTQRLEQQRSASATSKRNQRHLWKDLSCPRQNIGVTERSDTLPKHHNRNVPIKRRLHRIQDEQVPCPATVCKAAGPGHDEDVGSA